MTKNLFKKTAPVKVDIIEPYSKNTLNTRLIDNKIDEAKGLSQDILL